MRNHYYLISAVLEKDIYYNGKSLKEYIEKTFPLLYELEEDRITILYSSDVNLPMPKEWKELYHIHQELTKQIYDFLNLPQKLIVVGNRSQVKEIQTRNVLISKDETALDIRKTDYNTIVSTLENNYLKRIHNFFSPNEELLRYASFSKEELLCFLREKNVMDYQLLKCVTKYQKNKKLVKEWRNKK